MWGALWGGHWGPLASPALPFREPSFLCLQAWLRLPHVSYCPSLKSVSNAETTG